MEKTYTYYTASEKEYNYTPSEKDLKDAIVEELFYTYFTKQERESFDLYQTIAIKKAFKNFTEDNDNWEKLADDYEKELHEHFEEIAREKYKG